MALSAVVALPAIFAAVLGLVAFLVSRDSQCVGPNTLLWALIGIFLVGPATLMLHLTVRLRQAQLARAEAVPDGSVLVVREGKGDDT